jgi:hypothetical protein
MARRICRRSVSADVHHKQHPNVAGGVVRGVGADMRVIVFQGTCQTQSLKFFDSQRIQFYWLKIRRWTPYCYRPETG